MVDIGFLTPKFLRIEASDTTTKSSDFAISTKLGLFFEFLISNFDCLGKYRYYQVPVLKKLAS